MPLTQLDPSAALVVIDLQKGIVGMPCGPHATADVVKRSAELASEFRKRNLPVILVNVEGRAPGRVDATMNFVSTGRLGRTRTRIGPPAERLRYHEIPNRRLLRNGARTNSTTRRGYADLSHGCRYDRRCRSHRSRSLRSWL